MIKLLAIMDPIESINPKKDTTLAILLEAQRRHWEIFYAETKDIFLANDRVYGLISQVTVHDRTPQWITLLNKPQQIALDALDVVLMRKDPPFDSAYLYTTYLLELAQQRGSFIINNPRSIRDANEKLFTAHFPQCCPPMLVTSNRTLLLKFLEEHQKIVVKPLNSMGGESIFLLTKNNPNVNVTFEVLTHNEKYPIMAQRYIPEIVKGDKRILMIDGIPYPFALTRIPASDDFRGNLAARGTGLGCELSANDRWLCDQVGPTLREKGLFFVGLDVIGNYLTEINVTSPTCVREIENAFQVNICAEIIDKLTQKISSK